ncbi:MAG: hypothetical protein ACF8PN_05750 [Phycisphaerales bacterium]
MTRRRSLFISSLAAAFVAAVAAPAAFAQGEPQPEPEPAPVEPAETEPADTEPDEAPSLDELLNLEEAERDSADTLPDIREVLEGGATAGAGQIADMFMDAVRSMDASADRLERLADAGLTTQRLQEEAIRKLDALISMAEQQQQQQQQQPPPQGQQEQRPEPGSQQQSQSQASGAGENQDVDSRPPAQEPRLEGEIDETRAEWGRLPARVRDMIMQGLGENPAAMYRRMTERYYQRLADEEQGAQP